MALTDEQQKTFKDDSVSPSSVDTPMYWQNNYHEIKIVNRLRKTSLNEISIRDFAVKLCRNTNKNYMF